MKIVYELQNIPRPGYRFFFVLGIAAFLLLFGINLVLLMIKDKRKGLLNIYEAIGVSLLLFVIVTLIGVLIYGWFFMNRTEQELYDATVVAYQNGNYETVEGVIENFHAMPPTRHDSDSFDVNGVHFRIESSAQPYWYAIQQVDGGVFTGNGQYVRIGYVQYRSMIYIVKIEVLDETQ